MTTMTFLDIEVIPNLYGFQTKTVPNVCRVIRKKSRRIRICSRYTRRAVHPVRRSPKFYL